MAGGSIRPARCATVLLSAALAACTALPADDETPEAASGRALYDRHCVGCHGARGAGDGEMALLVPGGMPDLRTLSARNGGVYPRTHVVRAITRISELHDGLLSMPDFGGLLSAEPAVHTAPDGTRIATDAAVLKLADHLATLQDAAG